MPFMAVIPDSCPRRLGSGVSDLVLRLTLAGEIVEIGLGPLKRGADGHGLQRCGIRNNGKAGLRHCFVPGDMVAARCPIGPAS